MKKYNYLLFALGFVLLIGFVFFGVYSARLARQNVTSSVSFTVRDVYVDITYGKGDDTQTVKSYLVDTNGNPTDPTTVSDATLPAPSFIDQGDTQVYSVKVKNVATDSDVTLTLSAIYQNSSGDANGITSAISGDCNQITLAPNQEQTITVTLTLANEDNPTSGVLTIYVTAVNPNG